MKVFVWKRIEQASSNWHSEGGLVVFADTLERARELAKEKKAHPAEDELPDTVRECEGGEAVFIMPDAGCC
jgi:hypothetical protein